MSGNCLVLPHEWFNFNPTEEQVISYLKLKIQGKDSRVDSYIALVDFCKWEPWELPSQSKMESNNGVWWFLCRPDYKYLNSNRSNRTTETGYWKKTGPERKTKGCIGRKRILVFHEGPSPGKKTNWVLHEYYYPQPSVPSRLQKPTYVVCRLKLKSDEKGQEADSPDCDEGKPSGEITSDREIPLASATTPSVNEGNFESFSVSIRPPDPHLGEQILPEMKAPFGADESEEDAERFLDSLIVDPETNIYGATYMYPDCPVSSGRDTVGVNERYTQTWKVQALFVHLLAQRKSGICKWLIDQVKLYELQGLKIPYKERLLPLVISVLKRMLWRLNCI